MLATLIQRILQQLVLLAVVSVVLLAAYVSAGREFMPVISRYSDFLENQIFANTGIPVAIDAVTGSFSGFNPVISIDGLRMAVTDELHPDEIASNALYFENARMVVDMSRSIWQRRWVLEEFVVESLELNLQQNANGGWQLSGLDVSGDEPADLDALYQTFLSFTRLDLRDVLISVNTMAGESLIFTNGLATIRNQGDDHFLHVDANLAQNPQPLTFSMEVQGDAFSELEGRLHINMPSADYSPLMSASNLQNVEVEQLNASAELWIDLADGAVSAARSTFALDNLALRIEDNPTLEVGDISGRAALSRGMAAEHWEIAFSDMAVNHGDQFWRDFNGFVYYLPGQALSVRADQIELGLLTDLALNSGFLDEGATQQLQGYSPAGRLQNFSLSVPLAEDSVDPIRLRTNLGDVELGSVNGSPNMWGLTGYFELLINQNSGLISGVAEVESDNFSMNIPNTFTSVWDFDYVNGRLLVNVDNSAGERVRLLSSVVVAESDAVDGHVKFFSEVHRHEDGGRDANLELMVGAERVDAEYKALFLPDGPNVSPSLRNSMEFLERAILDGDIRDSGVIFRGSTVSGSDPLAKTFQSFFVLDNGELNYSDEWPNLNAVSALVITDDNNVDIGASTGRSLDIALQQAEGRIRLDDNDQTLLTINGKTSAATARGLNFLQNIPVGENLKNAFASWTATGDFNADVEVRVPLNQDGAQPDVRLHMDLLGNELTIPEFDIAVSDLTGPVVFDTRTGLEESSLQAQMFGDQVQLALSSQTNEGNLQQIYIEGEGRTTPEDLIAWPGQSDIVRDLLASMEGAFDYRARMTIDQTGTPDARNNLSIQSDLTGTRLNFPYPLGKEADEAIVMDLDLSFAGELLDITGNIGPMLQMQMSLENGVVREGLLAMGEDMPRAEILTPASDSGLIILGDIDHFDLQPWTDFVGSIGNSGDSTSPAQYDESIAFVDIATDVFSLYDQELPLVNFRIEPNSARSGWLASLNSDSVAGEVLIPYDDSEYLQVDLEYLVLPGEEDELDSMNPEEADSAVAASATNQAEAAVTADNPGSAQQSEEAEEEERSDPLLNLDPRDLPLMQFATDAFAIGENEFGSWEFTLIPTTAGAEFEDINFDFRGLRLGRDELAEDVESLEPHFRWNFDGETHSSELTGVLIADDIGNVLQANGYAPSLQSSRATFVTEVDWPGSPAFFSGDNLSGRIDLLVEDGRFNRNSGGQGALRLVSFINLTAVFQRLRFSDDLLRRGLAYDEIRGRFTLDNGMMHIEDRLVISGPSSLYQITGDLDLAEEVIEGEMFVTLPVSNNLPWIGLVTGNIPLAVGAYLFDQIFGDQVDSLSSAVYTLSGPLAGLEPTFKQAFGSPPAEAVPNTPPPPAQ
ncbi:MAG: DUF3971 domain-containing protein [Gammaproteobacteria bacterium]